MKNSMILLAAISLSACEISEDPADGGFLSGIAGVAGGGYQDRVDAGEAALAQEQARADALQAEKAALAARSADIATEIDRLRAQHTELRITIVEQVAALRAAGVVISGALNERVTRVVNASPSGRNDSERLAALQAAIADARLLSDDLARLA